MALFSNYKADKEKRVQEELVRLRAIEAAAKSWRKSLEDDGWTKDAIEDGFCRPGMAELMKLIVV